jgi:hypothetical protein
MKQNERLLVYAVTGFLAVILVIAVVFGPSGREAIGATKPTGPQASGEPAKGSAAKGSARRATRLQMPRGAPRSARRRSRRCRHRARSRSSSRWSPSIRRC